MTVKTRPPQVAHDTVIDDESSVEFLATLPTNPERDHLAGEFRGVAAELAGLRRRATEIRERLAEIAGANAAERARGDMLAERIVLMSEMALLPTDCESVAWRYAEAMSAWASLVSSAAVCAHNAIVDRLQPMVDENVRLATRKGALEEASGTAAEISAVEQARQRVFDDMRPLLARREVARRCASEIEGLLKRHFGDDCRGGRTDPAGVQRWVHGVCKAVAG